MTSWNSSVRISGAIVEDRRTIDLGPPVDENTESGGAVSDDIQQAVSRQVGHGDRPAEREAFGRRERAVSRTAKHHAGIARRHDVGAAVAVDIRGTSTSPGPRTTLPTTA